MYKITVNLDNIPKGELVEVDGLGVFPNKQEAVITKEVVETFEARYETKISQHLKGDRFNLKRMTKEEVERMKEPDVPIMNPANVTPELDNVSNAGNADTGTSASGTTTGGNS